MGSVFKFTLKLILGLALGAVAGLVMLLVLDSAGVVDKIREELFESSVLRVQRNSSGDQSASLPQTPSALALETLRRNTVHVKARNYFLFFETSGDDGSGIIIQPTQSGYIIQTSAHGVIPAADALRVNRPGKASGAAVVESQLNSVDVATVSVRFRSGVGPPPDILTVPVRSDSSLGVEYIGRTVIIRCYFDGEDEIRTGRIVSIRPASASIDEDFRPRGVWIHTSIPIEKGCSGAGLLDSSGALIGIVIRGSPAIAVGIPEEIIP